MYAFMISCQAYIDFCENQRWLYLINLRVTRSKSCAIYLTLWTKLWLPISIHIQHGSTWVCFKQYKLMHNNYLTHISIFRFLWNFEVPNNYSTDNCVSTWGKIMVAWYHILATMPHAHSVTVPNQTWEIGRVSMITRRYVGKREEKKSLRNMKSCWFYYVSLMNFQKLNGESTPQYICQHQENNLLSHFSQFQINGMHKLFHHIFTKWPPSAILVFRFSPKSIEFYFWLFMAVSNMFKTIILGI